MKISKYFEVKELVHPDIIKKLGEERAANIISPYLITTLENLRKKFGPIIINDGREFINSGVRKASFYKSWGMTIESYSTHLYGNTADCKFTNYSPVHVFDYIMENQEQFPSIVRLEDAHKTKTWLHIECGKYKPNNRIEVFIP